MFKRTKGYLLLTMLVLTGLAGRLHSHTLSGKERRHLVTELKSSRTAFTECVKGLTKKQLNFRPAKNAATIREYVYRACSVETALWDTARSVLKAEANPEQKKEITDDALAFMMDQKQLSPEKLVHPSSAKYKKTEDALKAYKEARAALLLYAKTSTDAVRDRSLQTPAGILDAYQYMLMAPICTRYYIHQIEVIKADPKFPK